MTSRRATRSNTHSGASVVPPSVSATDDSPTRHSGSPQPEVTRSTSYVDFETPCYPEERFGERVSIPGLQRIVLKPDEVVEFKFPTYSSRNSFHFLDHPLVADVTLYARNPHHVIAQRPQDVEKVFWKAEPIFVRQLLNILLVHTNFV
jgi:hypothetical protein